MPSSSRTLATAPISESVFFRGKEKSNLASFQSGRMELKILLCFTCPAMTAWVTPSWCSSLRARLSSPRLTQCSRGATPSSSGEASSRRAMTAMSMPWLRAASSTRKGNLPLPAIKPQRAGEVAEEDVMAAPKGLLLDQPARGRLNEGNQLRDIRRAVECRAHLIEGLRGVELGTQQQPISALDRADALVHEAV